MSQEHSKWSADLDRLNSWRQTSEQLIAKAPASDADIAWREHVLANIEDAKSIDAELQDAGVPFSVGELTNVQTPYPEGIAVLLAHLKRSHRPDVEESIIRALGVPYGGDGVFEALLDHLLSRRSALKPSALFALGNSLALASTKTHLKWLGDVVRDPNNGGARFQPLLKLAKEKSPIVADIAPAWLANPDTAWYGLRALRLAKIWPPSDSARVLMDSDDAEIRAEARRYLKAAAKARGGA